MAERARENIIIKLGKKRFYLHQITGTVVVLEKILIA